MMLLIFPLCRDSLMRIAKHYETGECLPEEVCSKLLSARTFHADSELLRQVEMMQNANCLLNVNKASFCCPFCWSHLTMIGVRQQYCFHFLEISSKR